MDMGSYIRSSMRQKMHIWLMERLGHGVINKHVMSRLLTHAYLGPIMVVGIRNSFFQVRSDHAV